MIESSSVEIASIERLDTGITGLNRILGGGLIRGSAYIVQGPPGAGKTVMANQICHQQAKNGENALYLTLLAENFGRMFANMQGFSFFDPEQVPEKVFYSSVYSTVRDEGLAALSRALLQELRKRKPSVVILDGLFAAPSNPDRAADADDFRLFVHELSMQAALTNTTVMILTNQDRAASSPEYTLVDGWIEIVDEIRGERSLRSLIVHKQRGGEIIRGRNEFRICDRGIELYPRLEAIAPIGESGNASIHRLTSGIAALDQMMRGGIPEFSSTVLLGPTGSGKTTVGLQFIGESSPDEKGVLFGFYETPSRLFRKAKALGMDLEKLADEGSLAILWQRPLENLIDDLGEQLLRAVEATGARRVFVDGINAFVGSAPSDLRLNAFLRALNDMLKELGATTVFTREVPQLFFPETLAAQELSGTIDNSILLHYALEGNAVRHRASILKVRDSDFDHISQEFEVTSGGVVLRQSADPADRDKTTTSGASSTGQSGGVANTESNR
ncbi:ATPase domain-containing protein [Fulvimarina sp. MAC8]|uniref:ATPase domain-containing protein n=1 Tax=Fulvimarina sp. MAC8 TaxID=3162874 RepID=UPI0032F0986B